MFVTHDQAEAFAVADRIAVMRAGQVRQVGSASDVLARPADTWVAGFIGYSSVLESAAARSIGMHVEDGNCGSTANGADTRHRGPLRGRVLIAIPSPEGADDGADRRVGTVQATGHY